MFRIFNILLTFKKNKIDIIQSIIDSSSKIGIINFSYTIKSGLITWKTNTKI